jgi:hypothetical protein
MARPKPGKCVHCLKDPVERNWDHVFPKSWYPDTTVPGLDKWRIPSCIPCNRALGVIEEEFRRRVGLCLDPDHPASRSVVQGNLRSMAPAAATDERERNVRAGLRQRMLDEVQKGGAILQTAVYPGMGEKWGRPAEEQEAIKILVDLFRRVTEKIVRGIFYVADEKFIESPYTVEFLPPDNVEAIRAALDQFGTSYAREPGVVVRRAVVPEDGISSLFEIEFWGQVKTYAAVRSDPMRRGGSALRPSA